MKKIRKFIVGSLAMAGSVVLIAVLLAFTPYPYRAYRWLATEPGVAMEEPDYIVVLGGGGIPSESGLMRSYQCAETARQFPNAAVLVAMTDSNDLSTIKFVDELVLRGVKRERILQEDRGRNTHEQAVNSYSLLHVDGMDPVVLLVTSPEHMKRSLLSFRKAGFNSVHGAPAFQVSIAADLKLEGENLSARASPVTSLGGNTMIRYHAWGNLNTENRLIRELIALAYYKWMGWI